MIFHVDVNSAFLSWSALKKLSEDPDSVDLRSIPSVVAGDPSTRHGIVTARSIPAKAYGIRTAMPLSRALSLCPNLVVVPSDFGAYRKCSKAFIRILKSFTGMVEQASIDEAYMDVSGLCADRDDAVLLADKIREKIRCELGFTVNIGISENKLLAKMASDFQKPDRTHTLFPEEVPDKMWPLPVRSLFGCGESTSAKLSLLGIRTIGDAAKSSLEILQANLGEKAGSYIYRSANGKGSSHVETAKEEAKSYSNEQTTAQDITLGNYREQLYPLLKHLSEKVALRLQKDQVFAATISVSVKTGSFRRRSIQSKRSQHTNSGEVIYTEACELAEKLLLSHPEGLLQSGETLRLIGVGASDLDHGEYRQLSMEDYLQEKSREQVIRKKREKEDRLDRMERMIREKYGTGKDGKSYIKKGF